MLTTERVATDKGIMFGANAREDEAMDSMSNERGMDRKLFAMMLK